MNTAQYRVITSRLGRFAIIQQADGSLASTWIDHDDDRLGDAVENPSLLPDLARALASYFAGKAVDFSFIETPGASAFTRRCWQACREIPAGRTITYAQLAAAAGNPLAARAAGQAMRRNPLPVIVPCHRVVGSDGGLHGFGGSMDPDGQQLGLKAGLLAHETAHSHVPAKSEPASRSRRTKTAPSGSRPAQRSAKPCAVAR